MTAQSAGHMDNAALGDRAAVDGSRVWLGSPKCSSARASIKATLVGLPYPTTGWGLATRRSERGTMWAEALPLQWASPDPLEAWIFRGLVTVSKVTS